MVEKRESFSVRQAYWKLPYRTFLETELERARRPVFWFRV